MKKIIILLVLLLFLAFPNIVYANGPGPPEPEDLEVLIDDYTRIYKLQVIGINDEEEVEIKSWNNYGLDRFEEETKVENQRIIDFYAKGYNYFYLKVTFKNKETVLTDIQEVKDYGMYIYTIGTTSLEQGIIENRVVSLWGLISIFIILIIPLTATIVIEVITGMIFRIKPTKFIYAVNAITNPLMNIAILLILNRTLIEYWVIVLILEIVVLVVEYLYYIKVYKEVSRLKLAIFTVTANVLSFALYSGLNGLINAVA